MTEPANALTPHLQAVEPGRGYVAVPLQTVMDPRMSAKALGLLTYALARQTIPGIEWRFYVTEIADNFATGVEAVETGLKELERLGYATYVQNPRIRGRFTGGRYVFRATSPSAPAWPRAGSGGGRPASTATGKPARGRAGRGESPSIQPEAEARPAPGAGGMEPEAGCGPAAPVAWEPGCSPQAGDSAQGAAHPPAGDGAAPIRRDLQTVLARSQVDAASDQGQAVIMAVEAALATHGAARVRRAVRAALGAGVRHPVSYLSRVLARVEPPPQVDAAPTESRGELDLAALRARVLDHQLRIAGETTARVQDVLSGRWPTLLLEDGREILLKDLMDFEVIA
ncbi:hypothetical protein E7T09_01040 [Deinococcus sp. KSM4-11]|uniref:hypothetical protein n=1 Tax=Deinococcus sp. KSM4-11 TaxID=2568654 RepID=UPI0010A4E3D9|nr:hypothetical protein [Deinococcus sp. KSM4-11]THF87853.1 hypothetical protein E7T09_01040 [Deinococcus sp. KSM4-11]